MTPLLSHKELIAYLNTINLANLSVLRSCFVRLYHLLEDISLNEKAANDAERLYNQTLEEAKRLKLLAFGVPKQEYPTLATLELVDAFKKVVFAAQLLPVPMIAPVLEAPAVPPVLSSTIQPTKPVSIPPVSAAPLIRAGQCLGATIRQACSSAVLRASEHFLVLLGTG